MTPLPCLYCILLTVMTATWYESSDSFSIWWFSCGSDDHIVTPSLNTHWFSLFLAGYTKKTVITTDMLEMGIQQHADLHSLYHPSSYLQSNIGNTPGLLTLMLSHYVINGRLIVNIKYFLEKASLFDNILIYTYCLTS